MSKERITCRTYCPTWNSEDKDCEIYGIYHPSPRKCPYSIYNEEYRKKFNTVVDFCVENGLDKRDSRMNDCVEKMKKELENGCSS